MAHQLRRQAEDEVRLFRDKLRRQKSHRMQAKEYLSGVHKFVLESWTGGKHSLGEERVMTGHEAKVTNKALLEKFSAHVRASLDAGQPVSEPKLDWKVVERFVEELPPTSSEPEAGI